MPNIRFYAGAPDGRSLNWSEADLLDDFVLPIQRFLQDWPTGVSSPPSSVTASAAWPKWRHIDLPETSAPYPTAPQVAITNDDDEEDDGHEDGLEFLEHSFSVYETAEPSPRDTHQQPPDSRALSAECNEERISPTDADATSFLSTVDSSFLSTTSTSSSPPPAPPIPLPTPITPLRSLPTAAHLSALHPQTPTVHLVAALVRISPPRPVTLRRTGRPMAVVELLLADETRAGFAVSFWLAPAGQPPPPQAPDALSAKLARLRVADVLLLTNVALASFRGTVFGQSLRPGPRRVRTDVEVLGRGGLVLRSWAEEGRGDDGGRKVERVVAWARRYLVADLGSGDGVRPARGDRGRLLGVQETLPPDTQ